MKELFKMTKQKAAQIAIVLTFALLLTAGCTLKTDPASDIKATTAETNADATDTAQTTNIQKSTGEKTDENTGDSDDAETTSQTDKKFSDSTPSKKADSGNNKDTGNSTSKGNRSESPKTEGGNNGNTDNRGNEDSGKNPNTGNHNGNNGGSGNNGNSGNTGDGGNSGNTGNGGSGNGDDSGTPKPHKHSYTSKTTKSATCEKDGVRTYTCSCGDTYTEKIPATGHHWEDIVETVWVKDDPVWIVDKEAEDVIVGYRDIWVCSCGTEFYSVGDLHTHQDSLDHGGSHVRTEAIWEHHNEEGHWEERGHYEPKVTGQKCTICGLIK